MNPPITPATRALADREHQHEDAGTPERSDHARMRQGRLISPMRVRFE
jgi:hypothetical protein